jgi:hypothetical protein
MREGRGSGMGRDTHLGTVFSPSRDLASCDARPSPWSQAGGGAAWAKKLRMGEVGRRIRVLLGGTAIGA